MTINCRGKLYDFTRPLIAGILNLTPDSFYDGGRYNSVEAGLRRAEQIVAENAAMIDIGAYSSRPGAKEVETEEEIKRLLPTLEAVRRKFPEILISVDTFRSEVAEIVLRDFQVDLINDIAAGRDPKMLSTVAKYNTPYIMMHMQGSPQTMQKSPQYADLMKDILLFFAHKTKEAHQAGVKDILIDPGFGFGKTIEDNYVLLNELEKFKIFGLPIYVGISRKSMIYKYLHLTPEEVLPANSALHMLALQNGANVLRVHDVKEAVQVAKVFELSKNLQQKGNKPKA